MKPERQLFLVTGIVSFIMAFFVFPAIIPHCPDCQLIENVMPPELIATVLISLVVCFSSFTIFFFWQTRDGAVGEVVQFLRANPCYINEWVN